MTNLDHNTAQRIFKNLVGGELARTLVSGQYHRNLKDLRDNWTVVPVAEDDEPRDPRVRAWLKDQDKDIEALRQRVMSLNSNVATLNTKMNRLWRLWSDHDRN